MSGNDCTAPLPGAPPELVPSHALRLFGYVHCSIWSKPYTFNSCININTGDLEMYRQSGLGWLQLRFRQINRAVISYRCQTVLVWILSRDKLKKKRWKKDKPCEDDKRGCPFWQSFPGVHRNGKEGLIPAFGNFGTVIVFTTTVAIAESCA